MHRILLIFFSQRRIVFIGFDNPGFYSKYQCREGSFGWRQISEKLECCEYSKWGWKGYGCCFSQRKIQDMYNRRNWRDQKNTK